MGEEHYDDGGVCWDSWAPYLKGWLIRTHKNFAPLLANPVAAPTLNQPLKTSIIYIVQVKCQWEFGKVNHRERTEIVLEVQKINQIYSMTESILMTWITISPCREILI